MIGLNFKNNVQMKAFVQFLIDIGYTDPFLIRRRSGRIFSHHVRIDPTTFTIVAAQGYIPYTVNHICSKVFNITLDK